MERLVQSWRLDQSQARNEVELALGETLMRITMLGTGTPVLDPKRKVSAILIEIGDEKLLFDAG